MTGFLWRMAGAVACLWIGLGMMFYSLERLALISAAESAGEGNGERPVAVTLSLFVGLLIVNLALFYALSRWGRFIRGNPRTRQAPVSLLIGVVLVSGGLLVLSIALHAGYIRSLETVPMDVSWGYIAFQVLASTVSLVALVLIAVRWSPGYRKPTSTP